MQLPAYWWLLALVTLVQGAFFVRICAIRMGRNKVQPLARPAAVMLYASGGAGLAYAVLQRDPLFFLGQACLLAIYFRIQRHDHDDTTQ